MTDEQRAELRRAVEMVVRAAKGCCVPAVNSEGPANRHTRSRCLVTVRDEGDFKAPFPEPPPLTPFEQMCLAGLLGDPFQLEQAVADWAIESGVEYATAVAEKARAEGRREAVADCVLFLNRRAATVAVMDDLPPNTPSDSPPGRRLAAHLRLAAGDMARRFDIPLEIQYPQADFTISVTPPG